MQALPRHSAASWQLILADLALILFLVTAAALTASSSFAEDRSEPAPTPQPLAPAQSLYRAGPGLPGLAQWLEQQPRDPRASLTIVAQFGKGEAEQAWSDARSMAATAEALGVRSRVIIREGAAYDVYASLAYDQPEE